MALAPSIAKASYLLSCGQASGQKLLSRSSFTPSFSRVKGCGKGCGRIQAVVSGTVPRVCTLREFGEADQDEERRYFTAGKSRRGKQTASVLELLAASAEASAQLETFESTANRLAMMGFIVAIAMEFATGDSIFVGVDQRELAIVVGLSAFSSVSAGACALAWRAYDHAAALLAQGYRHILDSAVDSLIEGLFFEEIEVAPWSAPK